MDRIEGETVKKMLDIEDLGIAFKMGERFVPVTSGVSFALEPGATLGIVGESGSGKSVSSLALMGLLPKRGSQVHAKRLKFLGQDLMQFSERDWRRIRGREIAMIFQDPLTSLNPLMSCGEQISESLRLHQGKSRSEARTIAIELLEQMGIPQPEMRYRSFPFEMSGGMRQRVMIAIALACKPKLLIADEPTTALDVTIQAQILDLIRELQKQHGMALILITHDLGVVQDMVEELMVMYAGRAVEKGDMRAILTAPSHPYTRALMDSIPNLDKQVARLQAIEGVVPKPLDILPGCRFQPRCKMAISACEAGEPTLMGDNRQSSACVRREELSEKQLYPRPV